MKNYNYIKIFFGPQNDNKLGFVFWGTYWKGFFNDQAQCAKENENCPQDKWKVHKTNYCSSCSQNKMYVFVGMTWVVVIMFHIHSFLFAILFQTDINHSLCLELFFYTRFL